MKTKSSDKPKKEVAIFGAGCFWSVQLAFESTKGVINTQVGYAGGDAKEPTYELVCSGGTGHAEVVKIIFDPSIVSYEELLDIFWSIHDPTQVDGQGLDLGTQYRSVIFFQNKAQKEIATKSKNDLERNRKYSKSIATSIEKTKRFYKAEGYHQNYLKKRDQRNCFLSK